MNRRDLLAAGSLFCAAGCSSIAPTNLPRMKRLRIATANEISRLTGAGAGGSESANVLLQIFDTLVTLDEKLDVVGRLATHWTRTSDTEWTFALRPGVRFSNGEVCDAHAVAHSIETLANLNNRYAYKSNWGTAWPPSARVIDEHTVAIVTAAPQAILPRLLCRVYVIPPLASLRPEFPYEPIGSGPYILRSWNRGISLVLQANPNYFGGRPPIDEMSWAAIPNPAARVMALRAGDFDLVWDIPYERIDIVESDPELKILEFQSIGLAFLTFNFRATQSPIADPRVRKALTLAIDAQGIRDALLAGRGELSRGPAPSQVIGAVDAGGYPARDVEAARAMLAEAGYPNGLRLTLVHQLGDIEHSDDICSAIAAQLREAGAEVILEQVPAGGMPARKPKLDWDIAPNGVPGSFTGEAGYHYYQLKSVYNYHHPEVEAILAGIENTQGPRRVRRLQEAMRIMWSDTPYLWSLGVSRTFGATRALEGLGYIPINWLNFSRVSI